MEVEVEIGIIGVFVFMQGVAGTHMQTESGDRHKTTSPLETYQPLSAPAVKPATICRSANK